MHPTRTTTTLLLGVACAVSAVSGCVNVSPAPVQPAAAPSSGVPPQHGPRGGPGAAAPVVVRAPALEALEAAPERSAQPAASASAPQAARRPAEAASGGRGRAAPPVPDIPEPRRPADPGRAGGGRPSPARPGPEAERELMRELPVRPADVCALGRRHGRWHPDSPEARICAGVQGG
uniref:Lipoprotein n=1 Tax=Streptomyces sp. NBC_00049 TaxID=2903617 RepID=A0AAU2JJY4_9ACTN